MSIGAITKLAKYANDLIALVSQKVFPGSRAVTAFDLNIADDGFAVVDLGHDSFTGMLAVTAGGTNGGLYVMRAASGPLVTALFATPNMAATNTPLAGTTGADGKLTVGITAGKIYIENRLGSTQRVSVTPMSGM